MSLRSTVMMRIIRAGDWDEGAVTTECVASTRRIEPDVERDLDAAWAAAAGRPGVHLFDGPVCRLESFDASEDSMHLRWSPCSYRIFLGTNMAHPELFDRFGGAVSANPIGMSVAVVTSDNQLLLGRRNQTVAYYPGRIHPIAGCLEPRDSSPFVGIRRELREELNLPEKTVSNLRCIGVAEDLSLRQMELIFAAEVTRTATEIESSFDTVEHRSLWRSDATEQSTTVALQDTAAFTPIAVATLRLFRRFRFE